MANNIVASTTTLVAPAATGIVFSADVNKFKSVKMIVTILDTTADKVSTFEVFMSYTLSPIAPQYSKYSVIGDSIVNGVFDYTFDFVYDGIETITATVLNSGSNELEVLVGEIERIE